MPADGEFTFNSIARKTAWSEYHRLKSNSCSGPALINCLFTGGFTLAGTYVYTHNVKTTLMFCGIAGPAAFLITGVVCTLEKMNKS